VHGTVDDVAMMGAVPLALSASFVLEQGLQLSGPIGDHGMAVLSQRESLAFEAAIVSDSAALHGLVAATLAAVPAGRGRCAHRRRAGRLAPFRADGHAPGQPPRRRLAHRRAVAAHLLS
jgi:hypothetical protein